MNARTRLRIEARDRLDLRPRGRRGAQRCITAADRDQFRIGVQFLQNAADARQRARLPPMRTLAPVRLPTDE